MSGAWGGGAVVLLALGGCAVVEEGPVCDAREIEVGGVCVAKRCGSERWRVPEQAAAVVFVDAAAARGGDGSRERPLSSVRAAFERVVDEPGDHVIAVAAGEYRESLYREHGLAAGSIEIVGRCAELTRVQADVPALESRGSWTFDQASTAKTAVSGLTLWGNPGGATFVVGGGTLALTDVVFEKNAGASLLLDYEVWATLTRITVREPVVETEAAITWGAIAALGGAWVDLIDSELLGSQGVSLSVAGEDTWVAVVNTRISGNRAPVVPVLEVGGSHAVTASDGALLELLDVTVEGNEGGGVVASGAGTEVFIEGGAVRGQLPDPEGNVVGVAVQLGAVLQISGGTRIVENYGAGLMMWGGEAQLFGVEVSGTLPYPGSVRPNGSYDGESGFGGFGILSVGGTLTVLDSVIADNSGAGVLLTRRLGDDQSVVTLVRTEVSGTRPLARELPGYGLAVGAGRQVDLRDVWLRGNHGAGVLAIGDGGAPTGLTMIGGGVADTGPTQEGERGYGIEVQNADVSLTGVSIERNQVAGLLLWGPKARGVLSSVQVVEQQRGQDSLTYGVLVDFGARLDADDVEVRDGVGYGVVARQRAKQPRPTRVSAQGLTLGPPAPGGADIGLAMSGPTEVTVDGLRVLGSQLAGVVVSEGTLTLRDARIEQVTRGPDVQHGVGIGVEDGGTLAATGLSVEGVQGAGLWVREGGLRCEGCTLAGTTLAGAVLSSGSLELVGGRVEAPATVGGVSVGVLSTAVGAGQRSLWLTDTRVEGGAHSAVLLQRAGDYVITGGELLGGAGFRRSAGSELWVHGNALAARDLGAAGVQVLGTTLRGGLVGLFLDHSSAALQGVQFVDVDRDLVQQDCGDPGLITLTGLPEGASAWSCALGQVVQSEWFADVEFNVFLGVPELEDALPLGQQIPTPSRP